MQHPTLSSCSSGRERYPDSHLPLGRFWCAHEGGSQGALIRPPCPGCSGATAVKWASFGAVGLVLAIGAGSPLAPKAPRFGCSRPLGASPRGCSTPEACFASLAHLWGVLGGMARGLLASLAASTPSLPRYGVSAMTAWSPECSTHSPILRARQGMGSQDTRPLLCRVLLLRFGRDSPLACGHMPFADCRLLATWLGCSWPLDPAVLRHPKPLGPVSRGPVATHPGAAPCGVAR